MTGGRQADPIPAAVQSDTNPYDTSAQYVFADPLEEAWRAEQVSLGAYQPYTTNLTKKYLSVPADFIANNVQADTAGFSLTNNGCSSSTDAVQSAMDILHTRLWKPKLVRECFPGATMSYYVSLILIISC